MSLFLLTCSPGSVQLERKLPNVHLVSLEAMETEHRCVEELWKASEIALAEERRQQLALENWIAHHERLQITFYGLAAHHEAKQARYRAMLTPPTEKEKLMDKKHEPNPAAGITPENAAELDKAMEEMSLFEK